MLCNVFDREGRIVDHPLNQRVMSVPIGSVRTAPIRVLAASGLIGTQSVLPGRHLELQIRGTYCNNANYDVDPGQSGRSLNCNLI